MNMPIGVARSDDAGRSDSTKPLIFLLRLVLLLLAIKVWASILVEYRLYFPADFSASFLIGREDVFVGIYPAAFYSHIVVGPVVLVVAAWLISSGNQMLGSVSAARFDRARAHRILGRLQAVLIIGVLVPSGLVMAWHAHHGPIAGAGFALLSVSTGIAMAMTIVRAVAGDFDAHRRWATRCFVLLVSPLILRISMGVSIVGGFESPSFYQFNAWASWLIPLLLFERVCDVYPERRFSRV